MNLLSWNCQGLGASLTVKKLKDECLKHKPHVVFLMETKQKSSYVTKIRKKCNYSNEWVVNPIGISGGLALWWNDDVLINILSSSANVIHTSVSGSAFEAPSYVTFVYGPTDEGIRMLCWKKITNIANHMNNSWMCVGDFNDIASLDEKEGGKPRAIRKILNFQTFISNCELIDLGFNGYQFT